MREQFWTPELERLEYEFHVRAFGEEMARIHFLPLEERRQALWEIQEMARSHGVSVEKPARGYK